MERILQISVKDAFQIGTEGVSLDYINKFFLILFPRITPEEKKEIIENMPTYTEYMLKTPDINFAKEGKLRLANLSTEKGKRIINTLDKLVLKLKELVRTSTEFPIEAISQIVNEMLSLIEAQETINI